MIEVIAHRGSHAIHPENTIAAVLAAVEDGAHGIEIDVHSTSDEAVVVHHDFFPRGSVADRRLASRPIAGLTLAEVEQFDIGRGERIPLLAELVSALRGRARLYVEIKGRGCEELVAAVLRAAPAGVAVHSFDHRSISRMAALAPEVRRGVLQQSYLLDNCRALASVAAADLWQHQEFVDAALVEQVHGCGGRVIAWTANEERDWERLAEARVDAICTDRVTALLRWLERSDA